MFKVHEGLRTFLIEKHGMAADASEADVKSLATEKLLSGEISREKFDEVNVDPVATKAQEKLSEMIAKAVSVAVAGVVTKNEEVDHDLKEKAATQDGDKAKSKEVGKEINKAYSGGGEKTPDIRVKSVVEQYDDTKTALTYADSSNPLMQKAFGHSQVYNIGNDFGETGKAMNKATQRDNAIAGAWIKRLANKAANSQGIPVPQEFRMTPHDEEIVKYALHECEFSGPIGSVGDDYCKFFVKEQKLEDYMIKTVADDVFSGGLEAVPVELDNMVITTPLLSGELFPHISVRNVGARRIEGWSIGNPTMQWGYGDQDVQPLFDTSGFIMGFDNEVHTLSGSIEIGRDFESDSPYKVGSIIMERFGERHKAELDRMIVMGNGINQPEGLFNAPGVAVLSNQGGPGAAPQIGDYEQLYFGIPKEFRNEAGKTGFCYISNDSSYAASRSIAVNDLNDARRIFGVVGQDSYKIMGDRPYRVSHDVPGGHIMGACLNRVRFYRRQGLEIVFETGGKQLQQTNKKLMIMRTRWGGALDHASAAVKIVDGQL